LRVAHFLSSTSFHGAETMTVELIRQLQALGVENHVLMLDNAGRADTQVLEAARGQLAGSALLACAGALDFATFRSLGQYLRQHRIDLVHSHKYKTTFYALPVCHWQRRGLVTTYHNWIETTPALRAYARLDRALARFNDAAIAVSTPVAEVLRRSVPAARCHQIDNGIDTARFAPATDRAAARAAFGVADGQRVLGCVGRLSEEKGLLRLLEALALVRDARAVPADWQLWLVGDGELEASLRARVEALKLTDRVRFWGRRSDTDALFKAMDLYLLPSHTEAFPMALLEAMSSACAVIAADVGEVARMLDHGACGRIVAGDDAGPWVQALTQALSSPAGDLAVQAAAARDRVVSQYSAQAMAAAYLAVYRQALGR
jgi:glycosyltransferase involved in cell wall biosynthesis